MGGGTKRVVSLEPGGEGGGREGGIGGGGASRWGPSRRWINRCRSGIADVVAFSFAHPALNDRHRLVAFPISFGRRSPPHFPSSRPSSRGLIPGLPRLGATSVPPRRCGRSFALSDHFVAWKVKRGRLNIDALWLLIHVDPIQFSINWIQLFYDRRIIDEQGSISSSTNSD